MRGLAAGELHQHAREMRALLLAARQRGDDAIAEAARSTCASASSTSASTAAPRRSPAPMRTTSATVNGNATRDVLRQHRAMQRERARRIGGELGRLQRDRAGVAAQLARRARAAASTCRRRWGRPAPRVSPGATDSETSSSSVLPRRRAPSRRRRLEHGRHRPISARWRSSSTRKNGAPIDRRDDADRQFGGRGEHARARYRRRAAGSRRAAATPAAAGDGPARSRAAADAARRCRQSRSRRRPTTAAPVAAATSTIARALEPLDRDAHVERLRLAQHQQIETAGDERHGDERAARRNGAIADDLGQVAPPSEPSSPERDVAQLPVVGDEDEKADPGIGERRDREPAEQEDRDRGAALARRDADRATVVVASAPRKAATGSSSNGSGRSAAASSLSPITMVAAAASAPPLDTPTSAGSASGLRNRPCMMAPAAASSAPIMVASAMRGSRIDHSTSWSRAISAGSPRAEAERRHQPARAECRRRRSSRRSPRRRAAAPAARASTSAATAARRRAGAAPLSRRDVILARSRGVRSEGSVLARRAPDRARAARSRAASAVRGPKPSR